MGFSFGCGGGRQVYECVTVWIVPCAYGSRTRVNQLALCMFPVGVRVECLLVVTHIFVIFGVLIWCWRALLCVAGREVLGSAEVIGVPSGF